MLGTDGATSFIDNKGDTACSGNFVMLRIVLLVLFFLLLFLFSSEIHSLSCYISSISHLYENSTMTIFYVSYNAICISSGLYFGAPG